MAKAEPPKVNLFALGPEAGTKYPNSALGPEVTWRYLSDTWSN